MPDLAISNPLALKDDFIWCTVWCWGNQHNLKSSAKNTPSNEEQFKYRNFWWIYNGHLIPGQRVKIFHPKISILQV